MFRLRHDHWLLLGYLALIILITSWHVPWFHLLCTLGALLWAGQARGRLFLKALLAMLLFSGSVSVAYIGSAWWYGFSPWDYVWRLNVRVLTLTLCTFVFVARINFLRVLDFSPNLMYILVIACGQIVTLRTLYQDFRLAWRSRCLIRPTLAQQQRQIGTLGVFMLDKSLHRSHEITQAMRSRGFFDGTD
jgi:cobalt/nickel transport system permease protein